MHNADQLSYGFPYGIFVDSSLLPSTVLIPLANALVSSRRDYCNSLCIGISKEEVVKLQIEPCTKDI